MIIPAIDAGLESMVRSDLPLPVELGDVSFEPPSGNWSAQLSRITINLFLFGAGRSPQPPQPAANRIVDGRQQRRPPVPMLQLNYLVTAWAGTVNDEHQLIGELLSLFLARQALDPTLLPTDMAAPVQMAVAHHDNSRAKDVWSTVGGTIRPSFEVVVTTVGDAEPYVDLAPAVERVAAMVERMHRARATDPAGSIAGTD